MTEPAAKPPKHILLVEDNTSDVLLIREALMRPATGIVLAHVENGIQALEYLRRQGPYTTAVRPHLILLDLNLPKKNGREVLGEIKSDPDLKSIPVVVLSSSSAEADVNTSLAQHANCYVTKPVDFNKLKKVVRAIRKFWLSIAAMPLLQ